MYRLRFVTLKSFLVTHLRCTSHQQFTVFRRLELLYRADRKIPFVDPPPEDSEANQQLLVKLMKSDKKHVGDYLLMGAALSGHR
jgi:hypothetical protein